jgi:carbonic anhydrase
MSDKDLVKQAAKDALSQSTENKNSSDDKTPAKPTDEKSEKAATSTTKKAKIPEKGSAEAEAHKQAALSDTDSTPKAESKKSLPQKGSAEAAAHNIAAKAAAGGGSGTTGKSTPTQSDGSNSNFLLLVLLLPLAVVGGLYAYATYTQDKGDKTEQASTSKATEKKSPVKSASPPTAAKQAVEAKAPAPAKNMAKTKPAEVETKPAASAVTTKPAKPAERVVKAEPAKKAASAEKKTVAAKPATPAASAEKKVETTKPAKPATVDAAASTKPVQKAETAEKTAKSEKTVATPAPAAGTTTAAKAEAHKNVHWDYKSLDWASLDPAYKTCGTGRSQSPIDIKAGNGQTGPSFQFIYAPTNGKVINNGHAVQVNLDKGNQLMVNGKPYELVQFHFHTPSENHINGKSFPMEVHLVHKNAQGKLAVVAVMITPNGQNQLIDHMPVPANKGDFAKSGGAHINPVLLLPNDRRSYTFKGSLTTPPCTQNVGWIVMQTPVSINPTTLAKFQKVLGKNNRPVQPANGRTIFSSF